MHSFKDQELQICGFDLTLTTFKDPLRSSAVVMALKLTRQTQKIAVLWYAVAENCAACHSQS
jgi:hypothetical protein